MTYAMEAEGLVKRFKGTEALAGVGLGARQGSVLGLLGPNGAGRTTAVRIFATLLQPDGGRARVAGHDVVREAGIVRAMAGLTGQYTAVDENLTGTENLLLIGRLLGLRAACDGASTSPRAWWAGPASSSSTSPRPVSTLPQSRTSPDRGDPHRRGELWDLLRGLSRTVRPPC